jgi:hypothetical protein
MQVKHDFEDAKKAQASIKGELGVDARVTFRTFSGANGTTTNVSVHLNAPPPGDAAALKSRVTSIVTGAFREHVDTVSVEF